MYISMCAFIFVCVCNLKKEHYRVHSQIIHGGQHGAHLGPVGPMLAPGTLLAGSI